MSTVCVCACVRAIVLYVCSRISEVVNHLYKPGFLWKNKLFSADGTRMTGKVSRRVFCQSTERLQVGRGAERSSAGAPCQWHSPCPQLSQQNIIATGLLHLQA